VSAGLIDRIETERELAHPTNPRMIGIKMAVDG
jgi:hypothetical protein